MQATMDDRQLVTLAREGDQDAFTRLVERHRIPLLLREIEGLSYREIAQALDLEEGTVKSRLARARLLLRKLLLQKGNLPTGSPSNQLGRKGGMSK